MGVGAPGGGTTTSPPVNAVRFRRRVGNLPVDVDAFVGRVHEQAEIRRRFSESRLVTLTGVGGVGKTRLMCRTAAALAPAHPDGAWLVELSEVQQPSLLHEAIGSSLGLLDPRPVALHDYLADRRALLLLDGCEHLLGGLAQLVFGLLRTCPDVRILASSRQSLGVDGESVLYVPPLSMPRSGSPGAASGSAQGGDAVALFAARAQLADPSFELSDQNIGAVTQIVEQVDGLPLAIEMAAARLRTLSVSELAERLTDRFQVLAKGHRLAEARHRDLRACFDWSHAQCTGDERELWSRLAVFNGGFEMDSVETVCAFGRLERDDLLDLMASLVEKSIVVRIDADGPARFRLLESVRDYAARHTGGGQQRDVLRSRHRDWFAGLAETARAQQLSSAQVAWWARLDRDQPDIRAVFDSDEQGDTSARLAVRLSHYWMSRGMVGEGRQRLRSVLDPGRDHHPERVAALFLASYYAALQGDIPEATTLAQRCHEGAQELGDAASAALAAHATGWIGYCSGDTATALACITEAAAGHRSAGDLLWLADALVLLTATASSAGDLQLAQRSFQEVQELTEPRGEAWFRSHSLGAYGMAMWQAGDSARAMELLEESLRVGAVVGECLQSVFSLEALALLASGNGDSERAAVLLGAAAALGRDLGTHRVAVQSFALVTDQSHEVVRASLGDARFRSIFERGRAMDFAMAVAFATRARPATEGAPAPADRSPLTPREREVAELIARGMSNKQIASALVISDRTARGHVENILSKLGLSSRVQVATWVAAHRSEH